MKRRQLLHALGATGLATWSWPSYSALSEAKTPNANKKIIWVMLRGGMDSLNAVVPTFDAQLESMRGSLIEPIAKDLLPIDRNFALHPALKNFHAWYKRGEFLPVVATANHYQERSHFVAQDMMESGHNALDRESGWLGRALDATGHTGLAISPSLPISLRGKKLASTWYPSTMPDAEKDTYERLMTMYENHPSLQENLMTALETKMAVNQNNRNKQQRKFVNLAKNCGKLMREKNGPSCAMLEINGWDTHNNLVQRISDRLSELDDGIAMLKTQLGAQWKNTAVIMATEFGRTVKVNGTKGSDHGRASALFLAGGAVAGGQVLGDWPGLAKEDQYQGRDLQPTSDIRQWFGGVLAQHWHLEQKQLASIFPDVSPMNTPLIKG